MIFIESFEKEPNEPKIQEQKKEIESEKGQKNKKKWNTKNKIITLLGILISSAWGLFQIYQSITNQPRFIDCKTFEFGTFAPVKEQSNSYESSPDTSDLDFSHAAENRIWIENPSDRNVRITGGTLTVNSVENINEEQLQMIVGTDNETLTIYIVNNTFTDIGEKYFELSPFHFDKEYPVLTMNEMQDLFQTKNFVAHLKKVPSGGVFKLFEFKLSNKSKKLIGKKVNNSSDYLFSTLFGLRHYDNKSDLLSKDKDKKSQKNLFNPFDLFYDDDKLDYKYLSQGNPSDVPSGSNSIPIIFVEGENSKGKKYPININSILPKNDTECLVQYIAPDRSCLINYSIDLEINGKKMTSRNNVLKNKEVKIKVPRYSIEEGSKARNDAAYKILRAANIRESYYTSHNLFTDKFKYNPKIWINNNSIE